MSLMLNNRFHAAVKSATEPVAVPYQLDRTTTVYAIAGTTYGYVHTTSGNVRTWETANGARRWIRTNYPKLSFAAN